MIKAIQTFVLLILGAVAAATSAQERALNYPPTDQPFYLKCYMQAAGEKLPFSEWPSLAFYFPEGIETSQKEMHIVDHHQQLEGRSFSFHIKATSHWSLIDYDGVPSTDMVGTLPQIMFLPPRGPANLDIFYLKNGELARSGMCLGMVGPNTASAYADAVANPSSMDN